MGYFFPKFSVFASPGDNVEHLLKIECDFGVKLLSGPLSDWKKRCSTRVWSVSVNVIGMNRMEKGGSVREKSSIMMWSDLKVCSKGC